MVSEDARSISDLGRLAAVAGAELVAVKTIMEAAVALEAVPASRPTQMVLLDAILSVTSDIAQTIADLRSMPSVRGAYIVVFGAFSGDTLEGMKRDWRADGCLVMSRGLIQVDEALRAWLASTPPPPPSSAGMTPRSSKAGVPPTRGR